MGATFCHLAALRSAIEFLFWDHWETAVLGQILAGRSREVTGANFCHLAASWPPIEFLFWDHQSVFTDHTLAHPLNCRRGVVARQIRLVLHPGIEPGSDA